MLNFSLSQIAKILNANVPKENPLIRHYCIDSRKVVPGSVFFAMEGVKFDGHTFLPEVFKKGAAAAVVSKPCSGFNHPIFCVDDVLEALQKVAAHAGFLRSEKVVAITGSMGKTTTKEFLATILEAKYRVFKTPGNQNTQISVPLLLLNLEKEYDVLVIEMSMSSHRHLKNLVKILPPDLAMVTRIAPAGMEGFVGGLEAIARAKSEIFSSPKTKLGLISEQAASYESVLKAGEVPKELYGKYQLVEGGIVLKDSPLLPLHLSAFHLIENAAGAISAAKLMGLSWEEIASKTKNLKPFDKRFEVIKKDKVIFVQDAYNANPDSMVAAFCNLPDGEGKAIGVLGTMPDLGEKSRYYHRQVGIEASRYFDEILCIGEEAEEITKAFIASGKPASHYSMLSEMHFALMRTVKSGDVVLIKGGNFLKLWTLL